MKKLLYELTEYLHSLGYTVGIVEEAQNEGYDAGFEDGYNHAIAKMHEEKDKYYEC